MKDTSKRRAMVIWAVMVGLLLGWNGVSGLDSSMAWAKESMDDPNWKGYTRVSGVSGNINSIGSDTLNNLMTLWAEGFRKQYPNVKILWRLDIKETVAKLSVTEDQNYSTQGKIFAT